MFVGICIDIMIILILGIIFNIYYITLGFSSITEMIVKDIEEDVKKKHGNDEIQVLKKKIIALVNDEKDDVLKVPLETI